MYCIPLWRIQIWDHNNYYSRIDLMYGLICGCKVLIIQEVLHVCMIIDNRYHLIKFYIVYYWSSVMIENQVFSLTILGTVLNHGTSSANTENENLLKNLYHVVTFIQPWRLDRLSQWVTKQNRYLLSYNKYLQTTSKTIYKDGGSLLVQTDAGSPKLPWNSK